MTNYSTTCCVCRLIFSKTVPLSLALSAIWHQNVRIELVNQAAKERLPIVDSFFEGTKIQQKTRVTLTV
jgi:hypothetical protein